MEISIFGRVKRDLSGTKRAQCGSERVFRVHCADIDTSKWLFVHLFCRLPSAHVAWHNEILFRAWEIVSMVFIRTFSQSSDVNGSNPKMSMSNEVLRVTAISRFASRFFRVCPLVSLAVGSEKLIQAQRAATGAPLLSALPSSREGWPCLLVIDALWRLMPMAGRSHGHFSVLEHSSFEQIYIDWASRDLNHFYWFRLLLLAARFLPYRPSTFACCRTQPGMETFLCWARRHLHVPSPAGCCGLSNALLLRHK